MLTVAAEQRAAEREEQDARYAMVSFLLAVGLGIPKPGGEKWEYKDFMPGTPGTQGEPHVMTDEEMRATLENFVHPIICAVHGGF